MWSVYLSIPWKNQDVIPIDYNELLHEFPKDDVNHVL